MKNSFVALGAFAAATMFVAGCVSGDKRSEWDAQYERFRTERPAAVAVNSGDANLDAVSATTAKLYGATVKYLDEYVTANNENRPYIGYTYEVEDLVRNNKGMTEAQASEIVLAEAKKRDEGKPESEQEYPRIIAGHKAVMALKPENKLAELAPLIAEAASNVDKAIALKDSFKGFDANTLMKVKSVMNVIDQAQFTSEALAFLRYRYEQAQSLDEGQMK